MTTTADTVSTTSTTRAINCPQCGGIVGAVPGHEHLECRFCHSMVFSSENPLSVDRIAPLGTELDSPCPCCRKPLMTGKLDEFPALYCEGCYGVLLRNEHFGAALRQRRAKRASIEGEEPRPIDMKQYDRRLNCPSCHGAMEVHPYYGPGNVVIDSCCRCGYLWLDHAELSRLERAAGGREILAPAIEPCLNDSSGGVTPAFFDEEPASALRILADWLF